MGPCDVLQDLRPRALRRHPLPQPVSRFPLCWDKTGTSSPNTGIFLTLTGKISPEKEESVWPITPLLLTFWSSAMTEAMLWYRCNFLLQILLIKVFVLQAKPHFNLNVFARWVRFMEAWWESSRGQWWGRVLMSGLNEPRWKIAT